MSRPTSEYRYHLVFSTSCSAKDWQSYLFFHVAMAVGQEGEVTHIVSGCDAEEERVLRDYHRIHFAEAMNPNFRVHFTPEYSIKSKFELTKYWNKPFGVKHWMEDRFGFSETDEFEGSTAYDNDVSCRSDRTHALVLCRCVTFSWHLWAFSF